MTHYCIVPRRYHLLYHLILLQYSDKSNKVFVSKSVSGCHEPCPWARAAWPPVSVLVWVNRSSQNRVVPNLFEAILGLRDGNQLTLNYHLHYLDPGPRQR